MLGFEEDDSIINTIEDQKNMMSFSKVREELSQIESKPKTKRYQGRKYFTKVGYTGRYRKAIPRWCTDMALLDRMVIYQQKNDAPQIPNADAVFGKFDPRYLELNLNEMFNVDAKTYS